MTSRLATSKGTSGLRQRAETRLRMRPSRSARGKILTDKQRMLHELQVHEIELELQNEELEIAKADVEAALEKYTELYEYAPAGYYTLAADGTIQLMNLTGASMVGIERSHLVGRRFGLLVSPAHRSAFNSFLGKTFALRAKRSAEFELSSHGPRPKTVRIEAQQLPNGLACQAVVVDISERKRAEDTQGRLEAVTAANTKLKREIARRKKVEAALKKSEVSIRRLLAESRKMQQQLRDMSRRILLVQEEQRKEISRELHDQIAQTLVGINIHMTAFANAVEVEPRSIARAAKPIRRLIEKAVRTVHQFARDLRPAMLDELGLITALISYIRRFPKPKGLRIHFRAFAKEVALGNDERTVLYRVAQEALVNVARHAQATEVAITVRKVPEGVCLEIADNGRSFDLARMSRANGGKHLGLVGMRERLEMIGGSLWIQTTDRAGTTVRATVPLGKYRRRGWQN